MSSTMYRIMYNCTLQKSKTYASLGHVQTSIRLRTLSANREEYYLHKYSGIFQNIPIGKIKLSSTAEPRYNEVGYNKNPLITR